MQRVLILDLNYHLRRCIHVKALSELRDAAGRKTGGVFGLLNTIQLALTRCQPCEKVIGVWDGGRSDRRLAMFPPNEETMTGYKVSRGLHPGLTPEERAEKEEIKRMLDLSIELATPLLMKSGVHVIRWPQREADDVISLLAKNLEGTHAEQVIIASDDWDFAQCCSERTCIFRPMADEWLSLHNFMEKLEVPVDWFILRKAVIGKGTDDIPGVNGVGPVWIGRAIRTYLSKTMPEFKGDWYDAHQYRDTLPADLTPFYDFCQADKRKKMKAIGENRQLINFNLELVDFDREPFPPDHIDTVVNGVLQNLAFDEMEVVKQLGHLNVQSLLENFAHWSEPFRRIS